MNNRLLELRKFLKLTQEAFAKSIGLTRSVISEMELGSSPILDRTIILICSIFNVNEEWLRYGTGEIFEIVDVKYDEFFSIYNKLADPLQKYLLSSAKELLKAQSDLNI